MASLTQLFLRIKEELDAHPTDVTLAELADVQTKRFGRKAESWFANRLAATPKKIRIAQAEELLKN